jgi:type VI protein secretion system component VasK
MTLTRMQAQARYQLERHGWLAAIGLLVLLLALLLQTTWVASLHADNAALATELAAQRRQQAQKPLAQEEKAQRQASFYAGLPDADAALEAIDVLNRAAARHHLALATAEYRVTRTGAGPLMRYQISLPLRGDYVALHAWLSEVLNTLPNASLDDISLKREDAGQTLLDARLRLTVFMRAP